MVNRIAVFGTNLWCQQTSDALDISIGGIGTVVVDQTLKGGKPASGELTILVPGGEVDGVGELYTHMATFRENEEVLVFANRDAKGDLRVTSGMEGKLRIERDAKTGARTIPSLGSVDEVSARVTNALKPESTVPDKQ